MRKTLDTTWELITYDVWGNRENGYTVNQSFSQGEINIRIKPTHHNLTWTSYQTGYPTDRQLQRVFNTRVKLSVNGDDTHIQVDRERDNYPLGELVCTSHSSLSPVKEV